MSSANRPSASTSMYMPIRHRIGNGSRSRLASSVGLRRVQHIQVYMLQPKLKCHSRSAVCTLDSMLLRVARCPVCRLQVT